MPRKGKADGSHSFLRCCSGESAKQFLLLKALGHPDRPPEFSPCSVLLNHLLLKGRVSSGIYVWLFFLCCSPHPHTHTSFFLNFFFISTLIKAIHAQNCGREPKNTVRLITKIVVLWPMSSRNNYRGILVFILVDILSLEKPNQQSIFMPNYLSTIYPVYPLSLSITCLSKEMGLRKRPMQLGELESLEFVGQVAGWKLRLELT